MSLELRPNGRGPDNSPEAWKGVLDLRRETILRQHVQIHGDHGFVSDYAALVRADMQRLEEERIQRLKAAKAAAEQRRIQEKEEEQRRIAKELARQDQRREEEAMLRADIEAAIKRRMSEGTTNATDEECDEDRKSDTDDPVPPSFHEQADQGVRAKVSFGWQRKRIISATTKRNPQ